MKWGPRGEDLQTQAARPGWGQGAKTEDFPLQMLSGLMFGIGSAWKAPRAWSSAGKSSSRRDGGGAAAPCQAGTSLPGDTGVPGTSGGSLAPRGGPWHIRGVPGTSGGGPWQPWCRTPCDAHGAQPHYVSCSHPHWLLVPGGRTMLRAALTLPKHPG